MRILIYADNANQWKSSIAKKLPQAEIEIAKGDGSDLPADYLVTWDPPEAMFQNQTTLKGIINLGSGVDKLLANPKLPSEPPIIKMRDAGMSDLISDYVRYGVLHFQRNFDHYQRVQKYQHWAPRAITPKKDWHVGILGLGAIGQNVAKALAQDGYTVHGWSRNEKHIDNIHCYHGDSGLDSLLGKINTLVTLLPSTSSTKQIIDTRLLAKLPVGASLINPGRGDLIDERALLAALGTHEGAGYLRGALLDVFTLEPLTKESPLWRHPRVMITPHMAGPTLVEEATQQVADAISALDQGQPVESVDRDWGY